MQKKEVFMKNSGIFIILVFVLCYLTGNGQVGAKPDKLGSQVEEIHEGIPNYYGGDNWVSGTFKKSKGRIVSSGSVIKIGYDSVSSYHKSSNPVFLMRIIYEKGEIYFTNSDKIKADDITINKFTSKKVPLVVMDKKTGYFEATVPEGGKLNEIIVDFGQSTRHYSYNLNPDNTGDPRFNSLTIVNKN
jgi:hypothetical protein